MLNDEMLNATGVASILHIGRNAVYDLAKSGELPSYKVGRKLLFSIKDVQDYLAEVHTAQPAPAPSRTAGADATNIVGEPDAFMESPTDMNGSDFAIAGHGIAVDIIAERLQMLGSPTRLVRCSSYQGLIDIYRRYTTAALIHLYDRRTNSYNIPFVQRLAPGVPITVFRLVRRWQGFVVAPGNPKSIASWGALLREDVRLANRSRGGGSRVLMDEKLLSIDAHHGGITGYDSNYPTGLAAANAVATGLADVAVVGEQIAAQIDNVEFVPLQQEWLDIAVSKEGGGRELRSALIRFFDDTAFKSEYGRIVHGEADSIGTIVYDC